ncbi:MAG: hypothetical protein M0000_13200 [Actinomycetota bacterium]|nr:hypothetical protein [Actinomycetota bacterium]
MEPTKAESAKTEPIQNQPKPDHELVYNGRSLRLRCNIEPRDGQVPECWLVPTYDTGTRVMENTGHCAAGEDLLPAHDARIMGEFAFPAVVDLDIDGNPLITPRGFGL